MPFYYLEENSALYTSSLVNSSISPGRIFPNVNLSIRYLINLNVGKPTLAVILLTCLFLPSIKVRLIQLSGTFFLKRIGGFLSCTNGGSINKYALAGRVLCCFPSIVIATPCCRLSIASLVMVPSTCTQYSRSCL